MTYLAKTWAKTYFILIRTSYFFLNWIRFSNYWFEWRLLEVISHKLLVKFDQFHHEFSNTCSSLMSWRGMSIPYDAGGMIFDPLKSLKELMHFVAILIHFLVRKFWSNYSNALYNLGCIHHREPFFNCWPCWIGFWA